MAMKGVLAGLALGASLIGSPAGAVVYFSNYTPSDTATTTTGGQFPTVKRLPNSSQSFDTFATDRVFQVGFICCTFRSESVITEFVAPNTFTASHLIVPMAHMGSVGNRNVAFLVERFNSATNSWSLTRTDGWATIPSLTIGQVAEVQVAFGTNQTNLPQFFSPRPVTINAGDRYRIRTKHSSGGIGRLNWFLSDTPAGPGQSRQTYSYKTATDLAFQPAFAFTDGGSLAAPPPPPPPPFGGVPEPGTWAMLILGFGLVGSVMRRTRAKVEVNPAV